MYLLFELEILLGGISQTLGKRCTHFLFNCTRNTTMMPFTFSMEEREGER